MKRLHMPRPRITGTKQTLINGLKGLEFLLGFLAVPIGVFGLAATTYGMLLFRMANLGGVMVEAIVIPVANTGMNGMIVSGGVVALGILLMRRILLIPPRYIYRKFLTGRVHAPRGVFGSPVTFYRAIVRFRNWFLAKVEHLQNESAKWKAAFNILKSPYSLLRSLGFSPQMAMTLLFAGSTVGTGIAVNEITESKSFSNGSPGIYLAPSDEPVFYEEKFNTLRLDLGATSVGLVEITDISLNSYTGSTLPSGQTNVIHIGGMPAVTNPAFTETFLEVGTLEADRWRCETLTITNSQVNKLVVKSMASDGQSLAPVAGTPRDRGINGGNRADDMKTQSGYYDMLKITSATSGVSGKIDHLRISNVYSRSGGCLIDRVKAGTMIISYGEIGGDSNLATKAFTIANSVIYKSFVNEGNVEVSMAVPGIVNMTQ